MYTCTPLVTIASDVTSDKKKLSICLDAGGFSFSEIDADGQLFTLAVAQGDTSLGMTQQMSAIKSLFQHVGIVPLGYGQMELIVPADRSVWVPDELFDVAMSRTYMARVGATASSTDGGQPLALLTCHDDATASTHLYEADDTRVKAFKVALPGLQVISQHAKMARMPMRQMADKEGLMLLHFRANQVDYAAYRDGRYVFGTTTRRIADGDMLYRTIETKVLLFGKDAETKLMMCGDVGRDTYRCFAPYFSQTTLYRGNVVIADATRTVQTHRYALILSRP
ncbi:MAG: DUF3822 family protein [Bacteroidales bacterium]|nr:DUF3822 family protein [Bacteroidales bacterium]